MAHQPDSQNQSRDKGWEKIEKKRKQGRELEPVEVICVNGGYFGDMLSNETGCQNAGTGHPDEARGLQERAKLE